MMLKTYRFICIVLLSVGSTLVTFASTPILSADSVRVTNEKLYSSREAAKQAMDNPKPTKLLSGFSLGVDIVGPIMRVASSYGQYEGFCRINLYETYFPVFELGMGDCNHTDESTNINFSTKAPYFRIGCDVNFAKNKLSGNRIFGGFRYGFSSFDYDISAPDIVDPNWGTVVPYQMQNIHGNKHWGELLFGIESRICRFMQIGWAVRYKFSLSDEHGEFSKPWYVPGFGRNKNGSFGANFNLIFDI